MLRLLGIVISIGLADSLNPSTVAPALYLATAPNPRRTVAQFTIGVFIVYLLGGALIALGPGALVLSVVPKPDATARHVLEVLAGVLLLAMAALLWRHRDRLGRKQLPQISSRSRTSWLMGATITALELPTAFPYFGALGVIVGSGQSLPNQLLLMTLFNVCFVMPLLAILLALWIAEERAELALARVSAFLQRHWPVLLAGVAVIAGFITIGLGATGTYKVARSLLHKAVKTIKTTIK
jgi:cytochrome c biogenesis protein CcdA